MQRRPGSDDRLGLDHIAFLEPNPKKFKISLANTDLKWEEQDNLHHGWISVWFGYEKAYEAKLFSHTALKVAIQELSETDQRLT